MSDAREGGPVPAYPWRWLSVELGGRLTFEADVPWPYDAVEASCRRLPVSAGSCGT